MQEMRQASGSPTLPRPSLRSQRAGELIAAFEAGTALRVRILVVEEEGERDPRVLHDSLGQSLTPAVERERWDLDGGRTLILEFDSSVAEGTRAAATLLGESVSRLLAAEEETRFFSQEVAERAEEIQLLTSISETLGSIIHLDRAAQVLLGEVVDVMGAERATLWVLDEPAGELVLLASEGNVPPGLTRLALSDTRSITAEVFARQEPLRLDPGGLPEPSSKRERVDLPDAALLSVPVGYSPPQGKARAVGVLNLIGRKNADSFSDGDVKLMTAIASQIGAAIENGRLVRESLQRERMSAQLQLAHDLQLKLLPNLEDFAGLGDIAARCEPAESVGGDFYHLIRLPGGQLGVMLGDVSSKGVTAGLIMALTMSVAAIFARASDRPSEVLRSIHHELVRKLESTEMFMTAFYAVIDPTAGVVRYANAGHPHAYLIRREEAIRLEALNPPLGIAEFGAYAELEAEWRRGEDMLLLFTDGLSECLQEGTMWSDERFTAMALGRPEAKAQEVLDNLFRMACPASGTAADDRTAVVVRL
ncbi:MAG: PP2C family protein-serine/threonine phosphatase [Gemmatimonadota bacterium]